MNQTEHVGKSMLLPWRRLVLLLFLLISFAVTMTISQSETPEVGSFAYWMLILPALVFPLTDLTGMVKAYAGRAKPILLFGLLAGFWHLSRGDVRAVQQLFLIVWVLGWLSSESAQVKVDDLAKIYMTLVVFGTLLWLQTENNVWGVLPGTTISSYATEGWRISFMPNIANSAMLSLLIVLLLTRHARVARRHWVVLMVATYFTILSFVRTATIAIALYAFMRWWLNRKPRSSRAMFWMALGLGVGINLLIASSVFVLNGLQEIEFVSRMFLRGDTELSGEEIYAQLYRPWLWVQHLQLFWTSPSMMGLGVFDFAEMQLEELNVGTTPAGNEAQLTRLLATYGIPGALYSYFFISQLKIAARTHDLWAVACFPVFVLLLMQWGNIFHPTDASGTLYTLIAIHGCRAFLPVIRLAPDQHHLQHRRQK
jgi:hypothetical protein